YVRVFAGGFFPWSAILVGRAIDLFRQRRFTSWQTEERLLWLWAAVILLFFSVARFKLDHYIFPAAPACCLIAARAWREAAQEADAAAGLAHQWLGTRAAALMVAAYICIVTIGFPALELTRPTALVGKTLQRLTSNDTPVGIYRMEQWRASLRYYAERPVARLSTPEDVVAFISE